MKRKKLGERLVERGKVSAADLESALQEQLGKTIHLGDLLLARGLVTKEDIVAALKDVLLVDYIDAGSAEVDPEVRELLPYNIAVQNVALPLFRQGHKLVVVMADPHNLRSLDQLRFGSGMDILPRFGFRDEINAAIAKFYRGERRPETSRPAPAAKPKPTDPKTGVGPVVVRTSPELAHNLVTVEDENLQFESIKMGSDVNVEYSKELESAKHNERTPAVRMVSTIVATAVREGASDIHIDPQPKGAVIRLRVDGMLRDIREVPAVLQAALISRIKILSEMDISERRAPQDGRVHVRMGKDTIDLRVSTLPTQHGEKAVIRLLNPKAARVDFIELGLSEATAQSLRRILAQPQGMLLVTGPTGSGKTTTLYAGLNQIRTRTKNIITVEDPVEYMLEGVNQVQVHLKAGRNFAECLRSILRQDPNVIMVGEIRDVETAEIALSCSQTGHMVLSTLHTNDSVAAITRLLDLGVPPFMIASSLSAVLAQRLVRRLCVCQREVPISPDFLALLLSANVQDFGNTMFVPVGCPACQGTGYKGRVAICEILSVNEQTRFAIRSGASPDEIRTMARSEGMRLMQEEALEKARVGLTSLEEVFRVIPFESIPAAVRCEKCNRNVAPVFLFCPHCGADRRASSGDDRAVEAYAEKDVRA
jgi:type IV pilus assembly protein PilB